MGRPPRGPVKVDKLGRPLNFGNYVNGRLVVTGSKKKGGGKGKGGSKGGRGGRGGSSGGGRGVGGGGRGGGGSGSSGSSGSGGGVGSIGRPNWLAVAAALGGRFASVAATNVAYIVAAELFPTSCRNAAVGWGSGCGRIGAIIAPMLMLSSESPLLIFTGVSLTAAALVLLLPESAGASLADVPE